MLVGLSAIPALGLAAYVYVSDVTTGEPLSLLVATFLLSILTATFAALLNSVAQPYFQPFGFPGLVLFFFAIVGPIEESVKLLAVRLYAYTDDRFDAVIDGAVYGAIAGLGFVVIENLVYIAQTVDLGELFSIATLGAGDGSPRCARSPAPDTSSTPRSRDTTSGSPNSTLGTGGPIVVKGLIIAAAIHALYNTLVGPVTTVLSVATGLPAACLPCSSSSPVFQGAFAYVLLESSADTETRTSRRDAVDPDVKPEMTEFED